MSASTASQPRPRGFHVPQVQRILPGPAGKLQQLAAAGALDQATPAALGLKDCGSYSTSLNPCLYDPCFQSTAWNSAKAYQAQQQAGNGPTGQLHTVQMAKELSLGKVAQMLVLLGSFQPSGNGSAFSKVQDPTGSIGAALHSSTLKQQPQLGPGCVLLLQNVSVFTPAPGTSYLAITANNIVKVWPAESAQDRIRNALHRPQPEQQQQQQQQQQQRHQQRHQQPSIASQQGSQQVATPTVSSNASRLPQQQQQQPRLGQGPTQQQQQQQPRLGQGPTQQQQQQGSVNTQQQQQRPRQTQFPPPSPHLPGLIDRSAGKAAACGQQQLQQSSSLWQQQQQQPGDCSPAVSIGRDPTLQLNGAAHGSSRMAGYAAGDQQQRVTGGPPVLNAAAKGSMPPPPPRMQISSFRGQLQKLQQTSQQQQQQQTQAKFGMPPKQQQQLEQQGAWPGGSAPDRGGSCGSLLVGQAERGWQQQQQQQHQGGQQSGSLSQQMDSQQLPPTSLSEGSVGPAGRSVGQQQQWQERLSAASWQPPGSQSIPPALLGQMHGSLARQQQQHQQRLLPTPRGNGTAMVSDGVDDVVAAIFGSQVGVALAAPAVHDASPTPEAAPAAAAIFGSQLAGTVRPPASQIAAAAAAAAAHRNTGYPQQQQQQQQHHLPNGAGRQAPSAGVTSAGTPFVMISGQGPSHKRFKPSNSAVGAAVSVGVPPNPDSGSQLGNWAAGQQQQQKGQMHGSGGDQGDAGLFGGLFGFQPAMQQVQQRNAALGSGSTQHAAKVPASGRSFIPTLGRPPVKQTNLLDDLIVDDLDDFGM